MNYNLLTYYFYKIHKSDLIHVRPTKTVYDIRSFMKLCPVSILMFYHYTGIIDASRVIKKSHVMRKPVYAICEQQMAQINLRIRAVWSAPFLFDAR